MEWIKVSERVPEESKDAAAWRPSEEERAAVLEICAEVRDVFAVAREMNAEYEREAEGRLTAIPPPSPSHS